MDQKPVLKRQLVRSTSAQISLFVDYMAANKEFANGVGEYSGVIGAKKAHKEWEILRERLKAHGADKNVLQWKQTWRDLKRKARRAVNEDKASMPIISDITFKVLETIGPSGLDCSIEIRTPESHNWEIHSLDKSLPESENNNKNRNEYDDGSDRSSEPETERDVKDNNSLVEVIVPMPQIKEVFHTGPSIELQCDPLQAPRPPPAPALFLRRSCSPPSRISRPSSATRRRQSLVARKRKLPNIFQQTSNEFVALEQRRLRMEEERDRRFHEREMERLKLELQRIEVQRNHNELLQHLVNIAQNAYELLQQKLQ